jgi:hypothetical protein
MPDAEGDPMIQPCKFCGTIYDPAMGHICYLPVASTGAPIYLTPDRRDSAPSLGANGNTAGR